MKKISLIIGICTVIGCTTVLQSPQQRLNVKGIWYDVLVAYEARLDLCFEEGDVYNRDLPGCEVDPKEARKVTSAIINVRTAAKGFELNGELNACTMASNILILADILDSDKLNAKLPPIELFCAANVSEVDLLFAATEAKEVNDG